MICQRTQLDTHGNLDKSVDFFQMYLVQGLGIGASQQGLCSKNAGESAGMRVQE